ncbi:acid sensing ion channel 4 [Plakobranchus ocellatus]|uniref:Acid sensing ion channel 4 n=1 Tax=Plakobranchus ocellatus TaxID=259542 RepID=A0AAV4C9T1_9GAST|nr:acid sensing ion channel 4 [Plakobranchus ocellatus]
MTISMTKRPVKTAWTTEVPDQFPEVVKSVTLANKKGGKDIKDFAETTTAHGLKYAFSEESSRIRRLAWFLAFLAALAYLSYQLVECSIDYYRYPMKAEYKLVRMNSMDFPTITICNLNQADSEKVDDPQAITDIYRVAKLCMWKDIMNTSLAKMRNEDKYRPYLEMR